MKKMLLVLLLPILMTACAPMPYGVAAYPGPYARVHPYPYRSPAAEAPGGSVIGRWDNVMMLPAGTNIHVLMADGRRAGGQITSADAAALRLITASGEVTLAAGEVMRVDRLPPPASQDYGRAAARGAAAGAGVVGVLGLLAGHMPPARAFAAGAIIGAGASMQDTEYTRGAVMIYLALPRRPQ